MNRSKRIRLLCGLLLIVSCYQARAQISPSKISRSSLYSDKLDYHTIDQNNPWWVNLGAGPALVGSSFSMNAGMVYCYQFDRSIISARILGVTNNNPTVQSIDRTTTIYKMADYGILYGPMWQTENGYISVGAGIGLVRAAYETTRDSTTNTSLSLPLEAQWFWRFTSYAGIGLYAYATVNFEKPFYGVMICAQLGAW